MGYLCCFVIENMKSVCECVRVYPCVRMCEYVCYVHRCSCVHVCVHVCVHAMLCPSSSASAHTRSTQGVLPSHPAGCLGSVPQTAEGPLGLTSLSLWAVRIAALQVTIIANKHMSLTRPKEVFTF